MNREHHKILRKASETKGYFSVDGDDARLAWELWNAKLIVGEILHNEDGGPREVVVMGITVAGRDELDRRSRQFWGWIFTVLAVAIGTIVGAIVNSWLGRK